MPGKYGRSRKYGKASRVAAKLRTSRTGRYKSVAAKRRTNRPVARIQRTPYAPQRAKNTASIVQLARQVRSLQTSQIGSFQQRIEKYTENLNAGTGSFTTKNPWAFCVNDFLLGATPGCPIFATGSPAGEYKRGYWGTVATDINNNEIWDMWQDTQNDQCSLTQYMPISSTLQFEFTIDDMPAAADTVWIRIDFVKMKNTHATTTQHQWNLPTCLPGMANLATDHLNVRNTINPALFTKVAKTKWLKIKPSMLANTNVVARTKQVVQFPAKILKPDIADFATSGESFYSNVALKDQVWCLINTSVHDDNPWPQGLRVELRRHNKWRDPHGVSTP